MTSVVPQIPFYVNLFLIALTEKVQFKHVCNWKTHWSRQVRIFHHERYKASALRQRDTNHLESNSDTMAQISGAAVMFLLLLTVSLFCQDTAAWGKIFTFCFFVISMQLERQISAHVNCSWHVVSFFCFFYFMNECLKFTTFQCVLYCVKVLRMSRKKSSLL